MYKLLVTSIEKRYINKIIKVLGNDLMFLEKNMSKDYNNSYENFIKKYNHGEFSILHNNQKRVEKILRQIPKELHVYHYMYTYFSFLKFGIGNIATAKELYHCINSIIHYNDSKKS